MSGHVKVRYWRVHAMLRNWEVSQIGGSESVASFAWSCVRFIVSHDRMLDDVQHVSVLVEEHPIWTALDSNVEEVVKQHEVLHHEFPLLSKNSARISVMLEDVRVISM
jgi:hypothetical protein